MHAFHKIAVHLFHCPRHDNKRIPSANSRTFCSRLVFEPVYTYVPSKKYLPPGHNVDEKAQSTPYAARSNGKLQTFPHLAVSTVVSERQSASDSCARFRYPSTFHRIQRSSRSSRLRVRIGVVHSIYRHCTAARTRLVAVRSLDMHTYVRDSRVSLPAHKQLRIQSTNETQ